MTERFLGSRRRLGRITCTYRRLGHIDPGGGWL